MAISLLFLVHLRGFFNDPSITLRDILECYYYYTQDSMIDEVMQVSTDNPFEAL